MLGAQPTVSVILPTYNREATIERAINSVLNQSYENFELILVNDGSTDDTKKIVSEFTDDRLHVLTHKKNRGAAAARNSGLEVAEGEFVAFQDSDDIWDRLKLEKQLLAFSDLPLNNGTIYTKLRRHQLDGTVHTVPQNIEHGDVQDRILRHNFIPIQTTVVRKRCFDEFGTFDERYPRLIDWEFWIRISNSYEFEAITEPLVDSYVRPDSISMDERALVEGRKLLLQTYGDLMKPNVKAMHLLRTGHAALKAGEHETGRRYLRAAFLTRPRPVFAGAAAVAHVSPRLYKQLYQVAKLSSKSIHG